MEKTYPSLEKLEIQDNNKPTLICDADEVIFNFMHDFLIFLKKKELFFNWKSYALTGNILQHNNKPLNSNEVKNLIIKFFESCTLNMKLINGAESSLKKISKYFNIIILSNIPFQFYYIRKNALINNNLNFPFFANTGEKGTACSTMLNIFKKKVWFIDDSPIQIESVKKKEPIIKTILFIDNKKLAKLVNNKNNCDFYSTNWSFNKKILLNDMKKYE